MQSFLEMDSARFSARRWRGAFKIVGPTSQLSPFRRSARQLERIEELDLVLAHLSHRGERLLVALVDVVRNVSLQ